MEDFAELLLKVIFTPIEHCYLELRCRIENHKNKQIKSLLKFLLFIALAVAALLIVAIVVAAVVFIIYLIKR